MPDAVASESVQLTAYTEQTVLVDVSSVAAAGATAAPGSGATVLVLGEYTSTVAITVRVSYGAAIADAPSVNIYTSPDGTNWDTDAFATLSVSYAVNSTKQKTVLLDSGTGGINRLAVQVVNNDASNALGAVLVTAQVGV